MKLSKGFTLIELIVVMAVFLFVIGTSISIFISIIQHQRRILAEEELLNQTSYVIEYMSKALRMAKADTSGDCLTDDLGVSHPEYVYLLTRPDSKTGFYRGIKFINQSDNNACQEFFLDDTGETSVLKEKKEYVPYAILGDESAIALTSEKIKINSLRFGINGLDGSIRGTDYVSDSDASQPRITILLDVESGTGASEAAKKIQTTVSRRTLNTQQ